MTRPDGATVSLNGNTIGRILENIADSPDP